MLDAYWLEIAGNSGGGMDIMSGADVMLYQSSIHDNQRDSSGGGIYLDDARLTVQDVTFTDNTPDDLYVSTVGAFHFEDSSTMTCDGDGCGEVDWSQ